jgi:putative glutamine amidotransferase
MTITNSVEIKIGIVYPAFMGSFKAHYPKLELLKPGADPTAYDLLIFPGGEDVNPSRYGQENKFSWFNNDRDKVEFEFFEAADKAKVKMYGSCRGIQLINVARGGTLHQDLILGGKGHGSGHSLNWERTSKKLGELFKSVNSMHHQGIQRMGGGLYSYASYLGIPEIVHGDNILATQFHPEFMSGVDTFFQHLVDWVMLQKAETTTASAPAEA